MAAISSAQIRGIDNARRQHQLSTERNRHNDEVRCAKALQHQTGCTWTEALLAAAKIIAAHTQ